MAAQFWEEILSWVKYLAIANEDKNCFRGYNNKFFGNIPIKSVKK